MCNYASIKPTCIESTQLHSSWLKITDIKKSIIPLWAGNVAKFIEQKIDIPVWCKKYQVNHVQNTFFY